MYGSSTLGTVPDRLGPARMSAYHRSLAASALLLLLATPLAAQQPGPRATLNGRIVDATSGTLVGGAAVALLGTTLRDISSELGEFSFPNLPPGRYVIEVRQPGYVVHQDTVGVVAGETLEVRFTLGVDAIPLEPITVVARSNEADAAFFAGRRFDGMDRTEIEEVLGRVTTMADLIRVTNTPGVTVTTSALGGVCAEHGRVTRRERNAFGQDECRPMSLFLDGVRQPDPGTTLGLLDPETVERFEILGPMQGTILYGEDAESGVIVVETQRGGRRLTEPRVLYPHDQAGMRVSFGLVGANPSFSHDGVVLLTFPGGSASPLYQERSSWRGGVRASIDTHLFGYQMFRMSAFAIGGSSTGRYAVPADRTPTGAAAQTHTRGHTSVGFELGYRPRLKGGNTWDLRFEIGPTLVWQQIALSEGHANEWADPAGSPPSIQWRDRQWTSIGVQSGLEVMKTLGLHWAAYAGARLRALYYGDAQSWELQETEDVITQTGNIVFFDYYQPVAFAPSFELGLTWRRPMP